MHFRASLSSTFLASKTVSCLFKFIIFEKDCLLDKSFTTLLVSVNFVILEVNVFFLQGAPFGF